MSIFKKNAQPTPAVNTAPATENGGDTETDLDEVMRKYDRESNVRIWEGTPKVVLRFLMAAFALFLVWMNMFATWDERFRRPLFVGLIIIAVFLFYPMKKGSTKVNYIPWYDIVLAVIGS